MKDRYVVDTNVIIAASTIDDISINATPEDVELRIQVWSWLKEFRSSNSHLVLDGQGKIQKEYRAKLGQNAYGLQVIRHKWDTITYDLVDVEYDHDGHAILNEPLQTVIHDKSDRKMVAAALAAFTDHGSSCIAFAADSDWHGWEDEIVKTGVEFEPIIEQWSRAKYDEKKTK